MTRWGPWQRTMAVASVAAAAAWLLGAVGEAVQGPLQAGYARALAGESATQAVVLVDTADADEVQGLAAALVGDGARLVVDAEGVTGCGLRVADGTCLAEQVPEDRSGGPWIREGTAAAAALAAIDAGPAGPVAVRYVRRLPTVAAARVVAGEIPAGTFAGRVVVVGRADAAAASVATPLGAMSPAQVLAQALLGVLDGAAPVAVAGWARALGLCAWAGVSALLLRRRGGRALVGMMIAALVIDAGLYIGGIAAGLAGPCMVATLVVGAIEVGLRVVRVTGRAAEPGRDAEPAASGLHARPSGPDQVTGA